MTVKKFKNKYADDNSYDDKYFEKNDKKTKNYRKKLLNSIITSPDESLDYSDFILDTKHTYTR